jgi:hypothetical protein
MAENARRVQGYRVYRAVVPPMMMMTTVVESVLALWMSTY